MTNLRRYLYRMSAFLVTVAIGAGLLYEPLRAAFMGNPVINSIILVALIIGIGFTFRQTLQLLPEHRWMREIGDARPKGPPPVKPVLLATVALMIQDGGKATPVSAQNMRSILDGVAVRLDESREISRYMIGLLVFLGLLGTFWGLLTTVQAVGDVVGSINTESSDIDAMMSGLKSGLDAPLAGMATAFSSSLFGLAGSLVLGFLDLQLGQASGRFYTDVEDWLGSSVTFEKMAEETSPQLVQGLSEAAADKMQSLARSIEASEIERQQIAVSLRELTQKLSLLADSRHGNAMLAENLANVEAALSAMAREMKSDRAELNATISMELRGLAKTLAKKKD